MQKAKEYIDLLRRTIQEMDVEINDLRRALVAAGYPLPMPTQQQPICGFPTGQSQFTSTCQSPRTLSEQMLSAASQGHLAIDQSSQLPFAAFGELALGRASFDAQDIDNISQLHSVLSKSSADIPPSSNRPISPVSPYQLEQAQGHVSGEFNKQLHNMHPASEVTAVSLAAASNRAALGAHV
ncbi:hypothetical protein IWW52_005674 [Coemansia sp. RSA 2704]|nr:hypothetical protein IWW54_004951 [Coemansia sp. RSA 2705]KAJ2309511.1 hypothetical protein IWW52_005674 [Coemansia sp. RSA 2704]